MLLLMIVLLLTVTRLERGNLEVGASGACGLGDWADIALLAII